MWTMSEHLSKSLVDTFILLITQDLSSGGGWTLFAVIMTDTISPEFKTKISKEGNGVHVCDL